MTGSVLGLDIEWLLSTLFDASLLSTSKPPETAALFLRRWSRPRAAPANVSNPLGIPGLSDLAHLSETIFSLAAGLSVRTAQ
jgi:hypothetical protein